MKQPMQSEIEAKRSDLARAHGFSPWRVVESEKVGIARNVRDGGLPIHGVRCRPERGTSGWYIWAGEAMSEDPDFFLPLHVSHLKDWCPAVLPYLELPPGWRFLVAGDHEDVWFDPEVDLSPVGDPDS